MRPARLSARKGSRAVSKKGSTVRRPASILKASHSARVASFPGKENNCPTASNQPTKSPDLDPSLAKRFPYEILIVEDSAINAKVLQTILKKLGYFADIAEDGAKGLKAFEDKHYDVVFMDLQMPVMDGFEATVGILGSEAINYPVFISAFTTSARERDRQACVATGMHDFIAKPARPDRILEVLEHAHQWLEAQRSAKSV